MNSQPNPHYATVPPWCFSHNMHVILRTIHANGLLNRLDMFGHSLETVRPAGTILRTPEQDEYAIWIDDQVLPDLQALAPKIAEALGLPEVHIDRTGKQSAVIICPRPEAAQ